MAVDLRDYQANAVEAVRDAYRSGARAPLLVAPTGAGKTVMFSYIASSTAGRGKRVLILVHRRELIRQSSAKLTAAGVDHGIIAPGHTPSNASVQVASVQTLARRLTDPRYANFDLIILDEAHHAVAGQWAVVCAAYPAARLLGVTATPERLDGRGLGAESGGPFDTLVMGPSIGELMAREFLVKARVFAPADGGPDLSGVATKGGDFAAGALAEVMDKPRLVGSSVAHYARLTPGLPAVAFCASVKHAEHTAEQFRAAGWRAVAASGETPTPKRDAAIGGLATGAVQVLCACDLISEGLDVPAIAVAILLRPTKSLGLYLQQVGRGLRPAPGKDVLTVLDHAANVSRHGMPEEDREWTLAGKVRRPKTALTVRTCPACFAVHTVGPKCPSCGHSYGIAEPETRALEEVAGTLEEVDGSRIAALRRAKLHDLLKDARTEEQLREIARAKNYHPRWVAHILASRSQRAGAAA